MLKLKLQYFGHLMRRVDSLEKTAAGRDWRQEEKGTTEDEMAGWHHWLDGHEFEQAEGVGDGQGDLGAAVLGVPKSQTWMNDWTELRVQDKRWAPYTKAIMYTQCKWHLGVKEYKERKADHE